MMMQELPWDDEDEVQERVKPKRSERETGLDDFIYQNVGVDKIDDLGEYIKWHRDNPGCSTPRAPRR